ncbi:flagellar hook-associated protein FlgK [Anoxybacillus gonensis]|uniref:flagellar hook-associated protein FlgK n=1 Tax=Anoxybacillus gonensis TaxID=198467 RepID=UPI0002BF4367|nr:flagellar hook-associated protein FlgK [Anoxybacillus gonensis]EMI09505.1 flagellar hook-associated protein FlgK [Anoxybacillus gonensis]
MLSTFHGLETVRRGMTTQQQALYVTGHNIANANTPGYSRQRVNFEQTPPYPFASKNRPVMPGQMGTGVEGGTVQRMREEFLDVQYRGENMKYGYWNTRAEALYKMEEIMNEPSDEGLAKTLDRFWQSLQDLAVNPSNSGARSVVRQRGMAVAETFHYLSSSLKSIRDDIKNELDVTVKAVNSLARQLNDLNKQISEVEVHGYLPNDLYDERNRLLDELSQYVNIKVTPVPSGGSALKIAEGRFTVELVDRNGTPFGKLVDGSTGSFNEIKVEYDTTGEKYVNEIELGNVPLNFLNFKENGKVGALLHSYGYVGGAGLYPEMLNNLNAMAKAFADEFNKIHSTGWSIHEIQTGQKLSNNDFFTYDPSDVAGTLGIHSDIMDSLDKIAASFAGFGISPWGTFDGSVNSSGSYDRIRLDVEFDHVNNRFEYKVFDVNSNLITSGQTVDASESSLTSALESLFSTNTVKFMAQFTTLKPGDKWTFEFEQDKPTVGQIGDGSNAQALAEVKNGTMNIAGNTTTIQNFYESLIGQMAVNAQEAKRLSENSEVLRQSVDERRMAVSSVSLDEEMMNMMKFQHAYNASARMITMIDQMLDKIINNMGLVGR